MDKIKTAVLTTSSSRTSGGLFYSVRSLHEAVTKQNVLTKVFAGKNKYSIVDKHHWAKSLNLTILEKVGPSAIGYLPSLLKKVRSYEPDIVHVHGLWMYNNLAGLRLKKKTNRLVVSPRGMLDKWALSRSRWKKIIAGFVYTNRMLKIADCIHALNADEYKSIREYGLTQPVVISPNGIELGLVNKNATIKAKPQWGKDRRIILFLGRIHPKKNITNLINGFKTSIELGLDSEWDLVIAGWDQSGHIEEIKLQVESLGLKERVLITGAQYNEDKIWSYLNADAFILPSYSEGLPVSVLEAWSYELPVLMTKECNISEAFSQSAAIEIGTNPDSIALGIMRMANFSTEERISMVEKAKEMLMKKFSWDVIGADMAQTYRWLLGECERPSCVRID